MSIASTKPRFGYPRMQFEESGLSYEDWVETTPEGQAWDAKFRGPSLRDIDIDEDQKYPSRIAEALIRQRNTHHKDIPPKLEGV